MYKRERPTGPLCISIYLSVVFAHPNLHFSTNPELDIMEKDGGKQNPTASLIIMASLFSLFMFCDTLPIFLEWRSTN